MIGRAEAFLRRVRRRLSPSEWAVHCLGLSRSSGPAAAPGLVLIQIDGLSRAQLQRALARGRMPFLRWLLEQELYRSHSHYSGVPSTTPAIQGELFYGVKACVPAFGFYDKTKGRVVRFYDPEPAQAAEEEMGKKGRALLQGGSSYSNIFTGGAEESHFCVSTWLRRELSGPAQPKALLFLLFSHLFLWIRTLVSLAWELADATVDSVRGILKGQDFFRELRFIPTRLAVTVLLRDLVAVGASLDIARGLPVVHLNFSAYDEHAHRRGPSSSFAHRALGGIDRAMGRVWRAAQRSARRDYDVWIYSDHGQEDVLPYPAHRRLSLPEAVQSVLKNAAPQGFRPFDVRPGHHRSLFWPGTFLQRMFLDGKQRENEAIGPWLAIAAMGPLGHIYFSQPLSLETKETLARRLVREAKIPLVLTAAESGSAKAFTEKGEFLLPEQAAAVFGAGHPFLPDVAQDMTTLCRHPDAGALLISGWAVDRPPLSLSWESGAHGGPGPEETHGFALLPVDAPLPPRDRTFLRPTDLRHAALLFLGRSTHGPSSRLRSRASKGQVLRLMTYNVHSCIGMDGKLSPTRIARVIARENVDVAALQELDVHRPRTGGVDQAEAIAERLNMLYHFQPAMRMEEEKYGDAILSRYPMRLVRAGKLPDLGLRPFGEPRGALWVTVDFDGVPVQVVNTHLGLHEEERRKQLEALLGPDWLTHPAMKGPVIFCGDFNAWPGASVLRPLDRLLRDAALEKGRSLKTWFGRFPLGRLDHVFVGKGVEVLDVRVPGTELEKTASDHLPLIVEARISL